MTGAGGPLTQQDECPSRKDLVKAETSPHGHKLPRNSPCLRATSREGRVSANPRGRNASLISVSFPVNICNGGPCCCEPSRLTWEWKGSQFSLKPRWVVETGAHGMALPTCVPRRCPQTWMLCLGSGQLTQDWLPLALACAGTPCSQATWRTRGRNVFRIRSGGLPRWLRNRLLAGLALATGSTLPGIAFSPWVSFLTSFPSSFLSASHTESDWPNSASRAISRDASWPAGGKPWTRPGSEPLSTAPQRRCGRGSLVTDRSGWRACFAAVRLSVPSVLPS